MNDDDDDTGLSALVDGGGYVRPGRVNEGDETDESQSSHREVSGGPGRLRPGVKGVVERVVSDVLVAETKHALSQSTQRLVGQLKPEIHIRDSVLLLNGTLLKLVLP